MLLTDISETDAQRLLELKNLLIRCVKEMKFSLGDAKVVDRSIEWFDAFIQAAGNTQKMEKAATNKPQKTEGLSGVKMKEFSPGNISKPKIVKPRSTGKKK